jgi:hypothetical protein
MRHARLLLGRARHLIRFAEVRMPPMNQLIATRHAKERMQQRGITEMQMQLIHCFGIDRLQKGGSYLSYVPAQTIREIRAALDGLGSRAVVKSENEIVITAMHQTRKVRTTNYSA